MGSGRSGGLWKAKSLSSQAMDATKGEENDDDGESESMERSSREDQEDEGVVYFDGPRDNMFQGVPDGDEANEEASVSMSALRSRS